MADDLMRIERQLHAIVDGMSNVRRVVAHQVVQCALYHVRGQGHDPHANFGDPSSFRDRETRDGGGE